MTPPIRVAGVIMGHFTKCSHTIHVNWSSSYTIYKDSWCNCMTKPDCLCVEYSLYRNQLWAMADIWRACGKRQLYPDGWHGISARIMLELPLSFVKIPMDSIVSHRRCRHSVSLTKSLEIGTTSAGIWFDSIGIPSWSPWWIQGSWSNCFRIWILPLLVVQD